MTGHVVLVGRDVHGRESPPRLARRRTSLVRTPHGGRAAGARPPAGARDVPGRSRAGLPVEHKRKRLPVYGSEALHRRFVAKRPPWRFGPLPHEVGAVLAERGRREVEQSGPAEFDARYVPVPISPLDRTVPAEKR